MIESKKYQTIERWSQIGYLLLCLILFDCMVLGGGSYVKILGMDIRMIYFALFFLATLPGVIHNRKALVHNPYVIILVLWGMWLMFSTVRGFLRGNRVDVIVAGLIGFASFGLLPGAVTVLSNKERAVGLMKVAVVSVAMISVQSLVVLVVYNRDVNAFIQLNDWLVAKEFGGCTGVDDSVVRIMFRSHPLAVFGCACAMYFAILEQSRKKWMYCSIAAAGVMSLLISYTRSIYLCIVVTIAVFAAVFLLRMDWNLTKRMLRKMGSAAAVFLALLLVCDLIFGGAFLSYGIYRTTGFDLQGRIQTVLQGVLPGQTNDTVPDEAATKPTTQTKPVHTKPSPNKQDAAVDINQWSDDYRQKTVDELYVRIKEEPIIGSGMGAVLSVRENMDNANEYFYLDQIFKTGIIGVLLYMAPIALMILNLLRNTHRMGFEEFSVRGVWLAGLLGIAAFCLLNPYLNGSNGIVLYCCTIGVMSMKSATKDSVVCNT